MRIKQYLSTHPRTLITLLGGFFVIFGLIAWSIYYQTAVFHIQSITPETSDFPATTRLITITFNKKLDPKTDTSNMVFDPSHTYTFSVQENVLRIQLDRPLTEGETFQLSLMELASADGDTISKPLNFTVKYVEFSKLDKEEQTRQINASDSFESSYKLVDELPIETLQYSIANRFPDAGDPRMPIIISMNFNIRTSSDSGAPTQADLAEYTALVRQYRTEAINKVKSLKGYDPTQYRFEFGENILLSEFDGTLTGTDQ